MSAATKISTIEFQKNILFYGSINCFVFSIIVLAFRFFNLDELSGLVVPLNCVIVCLISFYQIKKIERKFSQPLKFLRAFSLVFFTGTTAFIFFAGFILLYSSFDSGLAHLFNFNATDKSILSAVVVIASEGIGGSIVVALIGMMYSDMFADHEIEP